MSENTNEVVNGISNENTAYKYDAFISYRHTDLDKFVAEKIHKYLEEFKLPKGLKNKKGLKKNRIERVFRDKEELTITNNLEDPIIQALKSSEYLIVICSPRTKESVWCRKEIEKFIEFHGRNKILTVLIEGEPGESFPEELLFEEEVVKENGVETIHRKEIEPLAADIRGKNRRQMCALLKTELLRVIAPIFGLEYDDLRQRHRERKVKRIITATVTAAGLGIVIGAAGVASALIINNQKDKIQAQNDEINSQKNRIEEQNKSLLLDQAGNLADNANEYLAQDMRIDAIKSALSSLTQYDGMDIPYTAAGRYALTKALRVYDVGDAYRAQNQLKADYNILNTQISPSKEYLMAYDKFKNVYVWDVVTGELLRRVDDWADLSLDLRSESNISFVGNKMLAYCNNDDKVVVLDVVSGEIVFDVDVEVNTSVIVKGDDEGKYVVVAVDKKIEVYDVSNGNSIYKKDIQSTIEDEIVWCGDKILYIESGLGNDESLSILKVVDVKSGDVLEVETTLNTFEGAHIKDGYIYVYGGCYGSLVPEEYSAVFAVEEASGQIVWLNKYKDTPINKLEVASIDEEPVVVATSYSQLLCLNGSTGLEEYRTSVTGGISDFVIGDSGTMHMIAHEGRIFALNLYTHELYAMDYLLECNIKMTDIVGICAGGYYVMPMGSNNIIKYAKTDNPDKRSYEADEEMKSILEGVWYPSGDYVEEADKIGLENLHMVANVLYINENVVAVPYFDMTMDFYDVANKKVICTINNIKSVPVKCFGPDSEGNVYIVGESHGYCFDKDYNLVVEIDSLKHVDIKEGYMVIGEIVGDLWELPIYSMDDLINLAQKEVK
ncbi:MAG: TIR domain-containing protein [Lachnospiraceae bacterium]|nr:TIR domain-containing protein [Lachnospiraceae bacterium]